MQRQKEKRIPVGNTITVDLELPEDFITACRFCNICYQQAIETYLNHITFYNFFFQEGEEPNAQATKLFKRNNKDQFTADNIKVAKHSTLHKTPIKEILNIGLQSKGSSSVQYRTIIKKWHKSIPKD
ncbi:hypothetical protein [Pedobacter hiemivivus]|uniref:Uncharacterized protein n=1 Tax=Pedobacter hiemivivus TaxID=2530454 RepID=A0A4R0N512_9SPHI|nr:hypothetical protein [Pedobacter hiemivivus]TCC95021.1 hypothetical protein EZ444_16065 [Pedobacter hiemivivus]